MANRRMFSKSVIRTPKFQQMSDKARLLYIDISMEADDEGFVQTWTVVSGNLTGYDELVENGYIEKVDDYYLTRILDWSENNSIQPSKMTKSAYRKTYESRTVKPSKPSFQSGGETAAKRRQNGGKTAAKVRQNGGQSAGQDRIGQVSLEQVSLEQVSTEQDRIGESATQADVAVNALQNLADLHAELGFGLVNSVVAEKLAEELQTFTQDVVAHAMRRAALNNKSFGYALGILRSYESKGLIRVEDIEADEKHFQTKKTGNARRIIPEPSWSKPDYQVQVKEFSDAEIVEFMNSLLAADEKTSADEIGKYRAEGGNIAKMTIGDLKRWRERKRQDALQEGSDAKNKSED